MVFVRFFCHCEPVRLSGVAIPRLDVQCCDKYPQLQKNSRFLVVIVTWFHSSGGLPHQRARWFAMTGNCGTALQTPIRRFAVCSQQKNPPPAARWGIDFCLLQRSGGFPLTLCASCQPRRQRRQPGRRPASWSWRCSGCSHRSWGWWCQRCWKQRRRSGSHGSSQCRWNPR